MAKLHISIDDVKGSFKALERESCKSIFDTRLFAFLQKMHQSYGTIFYLYCTCKDREYSLDKVSNRYKNEFQENLQWLKFGFHCFEENRTAIVPEKEFQARLEFFDTHIARITGQTEKVDILRLHGFAGNYEMCRVLRETQVKTLLTADDGRQSYVLKNEILRQVKEQGFFYDEELDLTFLHSCKRLEHMINVLDEIEKYKKLGCETIALFTHEWQMDRLDVRKKLELCCRWGMENLD